jgi:PAS domain S-box-containing protein/putative nucleotidyltransferase with HDIG domain
MKLIPVTTRLQGEAMRVKKHTGVVYTLPKFSPKEDISGVLTGDDYSHVFEHSGAAVAVVEDDTTLILANAEFERLTGYRNGEIDSTKGLSALVADQDCEPLMQYYRMCRQHPGQALPAYACRWVAKNGDIKNVLLTIRAIPGSTRSIVSAMEIPCRTSNEDSPTAGARQLQQLFHNTIRAMAAVIEARDPYVARHQHRVTMLASAIATELGLPHQQIQGIQEIATVHDIGKVYIPAEILSKPTKLSDIEFQIIQAHPRVGAEILGNVEFPWPVAQTVLQHHERLDGSGYPDGLLGDDIILESRVLAVADVVEAIGSHRPYRPARGIKEALEELSRHAGVLYDREVTRACLRTFAEHGFSFERIAARTTGDEVYVH